MGAERNNGVKTVGCGSKETFEFFKAAIGRRGDLCPEVLLDLIPAESPFRPLVKVWIPPLIKPV